MENEIYNKYCGVIRHWEKYSNGKKNVYNLIGSNGNSFCQIKNFPR